MGGPQQRWSGSSVFQPLGRGRSFNVQLPMGVGHPVLYTFAKIDRRGNSLQSQRTNIFSNRGWKTAHGWCMIEMAISCIVKYLRKLRSLTEVPGQKFLEYCARSSCWSSRTANDQLVSTCHLSLWARDTCSWIWTPALGLELLVCWLCKFSTRWITIPQVGLRPSLF